REMGLFMITDLSPGAPFWLPNGMVLFNELTRLVREENAARGYKEVRTPILTDVELWKRSGHWAKYQDNMYFTEIDERLMGLKPKVEHSTRPENRLGDDAMGDHAEGALAAAMKRRGLEFEIGEGEGTFYGPKIDLHMRDSIGRSWQLGTVQLDYQMPERFGLEYTGDDNEPHRPVMIHRALLGSFERFIGILTEHYAGEFPLWLSPVQAQVLPIADRHV